MAAFPSYARILFENYAEQRESALLRTEMESGPPKQAKVRSRVMVRRDVQIRLPSLTDYRSFVAWFSGTINEGADWFDFTDRIDGTVKSARFVNGGLQGRPMRGLNGDWVVKAQIETWG